jgi:hypothetical protein
MSELMVSDVAAELVAFTPVNVQVIGKTMKDKRLSVINAGLTAAAQAQLVNMKGKVGEAVRNQMSLNGDYHIARAVLSGNYRPLAEVIAVRLGKNIQLTSRKDFEALGWTFQYELDNLRNAGMSANDKPTEARKSLEAVIQLLDNVRVQIKAIKAHEEAVRAAREQQADTPMSPIAQDAEEAAITE